MKRFILLFLIGLVFCACSSIKYDRKDITGTYTRVEPGDSTDNTKLTFNENNFVLIDATKYSKRHMHFGQPFCCDTIAYGTWKMDSKNGTLTLSTPQLSDTFIADTVREKQNQYSDTVFFHITNPIERDQGRSRYIFYTFDMYSMESALGDSLVFKKFNTNRIAIYNQDRMGILQFSIHVYVEPEYFESARNVAVNPIKTYTYTVKNKRSNSFDVNIPGLTYQYLTYLRLHDHIVKLINKKEIIWDGVKYRKMR